MLKMLKHLSYTTHHYFYFWKLVFISKNLLLVAKWQINFCPREVPANINFKCIPLRSSTVYHRDTFENTENSALDAA
jgi:hypothetical protein